MKSLKNVIAVIGVIVKYSAVVMAIIKGVQVVHSELEKLDLGDNKSEVEPKQVENEQ